MNKKTNSSSILIYIIACIFSTPTYCLSQVTIIEAPGNFEFVDMGFNAATEQAVIVGHVFENEQLTPTIFEPNANQDGFTTQTLSNLANATIEAIVTGISPDGSRIAGFSNSPNTDFDFEGITWQTSAPNSPVGIGFLATTDNTSQSVGAFNNGVVGSSGGATRSIIWDTTNGIQELPGTLGFSTGAQDVNADGRIIVGLSAHENPSGAAYYWIKDVDTNTFSIHRLDDNIEDHTTISSVPRVVSPNGNYIGGEILALTTAGDSVLYSVVWEGSARTLRVLRDRNGNFVQANTFDVSNAGIVVGAYFNDELTDFFGFIWKPEFGDNVRLFEDWLDEVAPNNTFTAGSFFVNSVATASDNRLLFTVLDRTGSFSLIDLVLESTDIMLGDVNRDGAVDFFDIAPFIDVLTANGFQDEADLDQNGSVDFFDIQPFIDLLSGP